MTTYTKPGRFPPASIRYVKPAPVELKFAPPEEVGERDEDGRLLLKTPLAPPPRPPTTVMPLPNLRVGTRQLPRAIPAPSRAGGMWIQDLIERELPKEGWDLRDGWDPKVLLKPKDPES